MKALPLLPFHTELPRRQRVDRGAFPWLETLFNLGGQMAARIHFHIILRGERRGATAVPLGAKIFVANHPTTTDGFLAMALPGRCHLLIDELAFHVPLAGWYLRQAGHLCVERARPWSCYRRALEVLRAGRNLVIAPEGDITPLDGPASPLPGCIHLALASGAPIIPLGIAVEPERVRFVETTIKGFTATARHYPFGHYCVTFGEPIRLAPETSRQEHLRAGPALIMAKIAALERASIARIAERQAQARSGL